MSIRKTIRLKSQRDMDTVMELVEKLRDKSRDYVRCAKILNEMYTSDEAIATRAAVARMCEIHNV